MHPQESPSALETSVDELTAELDRAGWGQPTRLFALVASDLLLADEPGLAAELDLEPGTLTAIEQDGFDTEVPLAQMLERIAWPEAVIGAAIAIEQVVLPPAAEAELPESADPTEVAEAAAADPRATSLRIIAAVTRNGLEDTVFVVDSHPEPIRGGEDERLAPALIEALARSFRPADAL